MRKTLLAAALGASILAAPAFAQDVAPFTGFRAEGVLGWDRLGDGVDRDSGIVYGAQLGYDAQAGRAIVGLEGELTGSTTDLRAASVLVPGDRLALDAGRDLYLGGRVGIAVTPTAMLYAKGGYTNARVETDYTIGNTSVRDGENMDGYRVGAGAEMAIGRSTYVKGEYRYSNYGRVAGESIDVDRHQLLAGVGVRF